MDAIQQIIEITERDREDWVRLREVCMPANRDLCDRMILMYDNTLKVMRQVSVPAETDASHRPGS